jgi:hypothetical protein
MSQTIIIHPGSMYLKIGRASDLNPIIDLNCIARKRKNHHLYVYSDTMLPQCYTSLSKGNLSAAFPLMLFLVTYLDL